VTTVLLADVLHLDDVAVVERPGEPRLGDEHLDELGVRRLLLADPLDHDVALEAFEAARLGQQEVRHPTLRQLSQDLIPAELGSSGDGRHHNPSVCP
jgi:hypothetical protein